MSFSKIDLIKIIRTSLHYSLTDSKFAVEFFVGAYGLHVNEYTYEFSMNTLLAFTKFCALFASNRIFIEDGKIFPAQAQALTGADVIFLIDNPVTM